MTSIFNKIRELEGISRMSKHDQLVNGIINAIDEKIILLGDRLPSVNTMVEELGFARKTIVKAYSDLKDRGIVESRKRFGYFIANDSTGQTAKVALVLYAFQTFQEIFYNTFRAGLGANIHIDIFFHHNNREVFETVLANIKGNYGMYVIAPIPYKKGISLIKQIPTNKLLIIDRTLEMANPISSITQSFEIPFYKELVSAKEAIKKYKQLVLFYRENADFPQGIQKGFKRFVKDFKLNGKIEKQYILDSVKKDTLYFTINNTELWEILKDSKKKDLLIGKDFGIISQNDSPVKEFIFGGISTFSTDFKLMAQKAAAFVIEREPIQEVIPSVLIDRGSF